MQVLATTGAVLSGFRYPGQDRRLTAIGATVADNVRLGIPETITDQISVTAHV